MKRRTVVAVALVALLLVSGALFAQANFDLRYDPNSVVTISGTVLTTISYNPGNPALGPQAVLVSSGGQVYNVFLGPTTYSSQIGFVPTAGSSITVTGSQRNLAGQSYLVAQSITSPSGTYTFRSTTGTPSWMSTQMITPPVGSGASLSPVARIPFDPSNIVKVSGKVRSGTLMMTAEGNVPVVVARIEDEKALSEDRFYDVVLAPLSYLTENGISLQEGNTLFVEGSKVAIGGRDMIVATNVEESEHLIGLRTLYGAPLFSSVTAPIGAGPSEQVLVPFDTNNMVEVSGKVQQTYFMNTPEDNVPSVVAVIKDNKQTYPVLLGPQSFLTENCISTNPGDTLFVMGSKVNINGRTGIVATSVEESEHRISLRSNTGVALFPTFTPMNIPAPPK